MLYILQGPSRAAKTSFTKSLFARPFVYTCQDGDTLDLRGFRYGHHDALILDNLVDFSLILKYRALLQANNDEHRLGQSATGMYSYGVYLWATPILATVDLEVDAVGAIAASEWLSANVLLDRIPQGEVCFMPGAQLQIPMSRMPAFGL